jgi:choline dehydrogenase-like flavoprotein
LEPWLLEAEQETGVSANEDNPYASARSGPFPMPAHPFSYFDREIFSSALKRLGIVGHSCPRAINSEEYQGRSTCMACRACKFCPSGARYSPDRVHVRRLKELQNVHILNKVSLRRLETNSAGTAISVAHAAFVEDKSPLLVRAKRFILAIGGVETPRMLMLSSDKGQHREGLGNSGGQLGQGFSDHLNPALTIDVGQPVGGRLGFETMISDHFRAQNNRHEHPSYMIFGAPAVDWDSVAAEATEWSLKGDVLSLEHLRRSIPQMATVYTMTELRGEGTLALDETAVDEFGSPLAKVTMKITEWDRRGAEQMAELAPKLAEEMGAKRISEITPLEFGLGYHPSGATAMARTPEEGVCDSNLRVFELDNLYLASNSVFPHMGANPPTLTIAALALRLAAHLEGRSRS